MRSTCHALLASDVCVVDGLRIRWRRRLLGKPPELCLDARDECAACGQPIVAPADQSEELLESCDLAQNSYDVETMTKIQ